MSDIIDEAAEWEEELREQALKQRKPNGPAPTGYCLDEGCAEELPAGMRWCNAEHRDNYYRQLRVKLDKMGKYYDEE